MQGWRARVGAKKIPGLRLTCAEFVEKYGMAEVLGSAAAVVAWVAGISTGHVGATAGSWALAAESSAFYAPLLGKELRTGWRETGGARRWTRPLVVLGRALRNSLVRFLPSEMADQVFRAPATTLLPAAAAAGTMALELPWGLTVTAATTAWAAGKVSADWVFYRIAQPFDQWVTDHWSLKADLERQEGERAPCSEADRAVEHVRAAGTTGVDEPTSSAASLSASVPGAAAVTPPPPPPPPLPRPTGPVDDQRAARGRRIPTPGPHGNGGGTPGSLVERGRHEAGERSPGGHGLA